MQTLKKKVRIADYMSIFIVNAHYKIVMGGQLGLSDKSIANYKNFRTIIAAYETYLKKDFLFHELSAQSIEGFKRYLLEEKKYSLNHAGRLMGFLKTVCKTAANYHIDTANSTHLIAGFSSAQQDKIIHTISFEEYQRIISLDYSSNERLKNTRKWLVIGFWLGQRVSDLLTLKTSQTRVAPNGGLYIDIVQQKTKKRVTLGVIDPLALKIIKTDFPRAIGARCFNRYMKEICQDAGMTQIVKGFKLNPKTNRKELGLFPKYELLSSHDLRRSFATNFFGKIETPVLMQMTGHSRESTFLSYIGVGENKDIYANSFMQGLMEMKGVSKT
jgi:integrase